MKQLFSFFFLLFVCMNCWSQNVDSLAQDDYDENQWFPLKRLYEQRRDSMSDRMQRLAEAMLQNAFNDCSKAERSLDKLLRNSDEESANTQMYIAYSLANCRFRMGKLKEAVLTLANSLQKFGKDLSPDVKSNYAQTLDFYRLQESRGKVNFVRSENVRIPFFLDSVGGGYDKSVLVRMNGFVNGYPVSMTLDTGAACNVITPELARKFHLDISNSSLDVVGSDTVNTQIAFARELKIGNVTCYNMPFVLADLNAENVNESDKPLCPGGIVGLPFVHMLQRMDICFDSLMILSPKNSEDIYQDANLCYDNTTELLQLEYWHQDKRLCCIPDFGATVSSLGRHYMKQFHNEAEHTGKTLNLAYWGIGGTENVPGYQLYNFDVTIDGHQVHIPRVKAIQADGFEDLLGMDYFSKCKRVTIDLRKMVLKVDFF